MKPFFIHLNEHMLFSPKRQFNGATLYVAPHPDPNNTRDIEVRVTFCSRKDNYCKKTGREMSMAAVGKIINKRNLPELVDAVDRVVKGAPPRPVWGQASQWHYLWKYLL